MNQVDGKVDGQRMCRVLTFSRAISDSCCCCSDVLDDPFLERDPVDPAVDGVGRSGS